MPKVNGRTGMLPPIESGHVSKRVQSVEVDPTRGAGALNQIDS